MSGRSALDPVPGELSPVRLMVKVEALDEALDAMEAEGLRDSDAYRLLTRNRNKLAESAAMSSVGDTEAVLRIPPDERPALMTSLNNTRQRSSGSERDAYRRLSESVSDGDCVLYRFVFPRESIGNLHGAAAAWNDTEETRTPVAARRLEAIMQREDA